MNEYIHGYTFFRVIQYFELTDNYFVLDMNSTRPYMLPSHPYPMPPSANTPGPGGEYVPYDPNTGLVYAPQP